MVAFFDSRKRIRMAVFVSRDVLWRRLTSITNADLSLMGKPSE
jgi:hypothetical protein